jgi:hypothetical protein
VCATPSHAGAFWYVLYSSSTIVAMTVAMSAIIMQSRAIICTKFYTSKIEATEIFHL